MAPRRRRPRKNNRRRYETVSCELTAFISKTTVFKFSDLKIDFGDRPVRVMHMAVTAACTASTRFPIVQLALYSVNAEPTARSIARVVSNTVSRFSVRAPGFTDFGLFNATASVGAIDVYGVAEGAISCSIVFKVQLATGSVPRPVTRYEASD